MRGMPFPDIISGDFYRLVSFLESNDVNKKPDKGLIEKFDNWMEKQLRDSGAENLIKPSLRLGYISKEDNEDIVKKPKKEPKEKKPKAEKDENGFRKGTKKSYTVELAKKKYSLERVIKKVMKKFEDASEKSITIWYRKAIGKDAWDKQKPKKEKKERVQKVYTQAELDIKKAKAKERAEVRKAKRRALSIIRAENKIKKEAELAEKKKLKRKKKKLAKASKLKG